MAYYEGMCRHGPWDGRHCKWDKRTFQPFIDGWLEEPAEEPMDADPPPNPHAIFTSGEYRWEHNHWKWYLHREKV